MDDAKARHIRARWAEALSRARDWEQRSTVDVNQAVDVAADDVLGGGDAAG